MAFFDDKKGNQKNKSNKQPDRIRPQGKRGMSSAKAEQKTRREWNSLDHEERVESMEYESERRKQAMLASMEYEDEYEEYETSGQDSYKQEIYEEAPGMVRSRPVRRRGEEESSPHRQMTGNRDGMVEISFENTNPYPQNHQIETSFTDYDDDFSEESQCIREIGRTSDIAFLEIEEELAAQEEEKVPAKEPVKGKFHSLFQKPVYQKIDEIKPPYEEESGFDPDEMEYGDEPYEDAFYEDEALKGYEQDTDGAYEEEPYYGAAGYEDDACEYDSYSENDTYRYQDDREHSAFGEDPFYEEEEDNTYYEEPPFYEEERYESYEEEEEGAYRKKQRAKKDTVYAPYEKAGFIDKLFYKLHHMEMIDWVLAATGSVVVIALVVVAVLFLGNSKTAVMDESMLTFAEIGKQMDELLILGEKGLDDVTESFRNPIPETEETKETLETQSEQSELVGLMLNVSSLEHDMKIKIVNVETGKMVPGYAFQAILKNEKNEDHYFTDDDKDGLIKIKGLKKGNYEVRLAKDDTLSKQFIFSDIVVNQTIKDTVDYVKVDIADEVKTEDQINAKKEDTAGKKEASEEKAPALKDTVEWVESTKTLLGGEAAYKELSTDQIKNPATAMLEKNFRKVEGEGIGIRSTENVTEIDQGENRTYHFYAETVNTPPNFRIQWDIAGGAITAGTYSGENIELCFGAFSGKVKITASMVAIADDGTEAVVATDYYEVKVKEVDQSNIVATTEKGSLIMKVGETQSVQNTKNLDTAVIWSWKSSDDAVLSVTGTDGTAVITAKASGSANVIGVAKTVNGVKYHTVFYTVSVVDDAAPSATLDKTSQTVVSGDSFELNVIGQNLNDVAFQVTFASANENIATVELLSNQNGVATARVNTVAGKKQNKEVNISATVVIIRGEQVLFQQKLFCKVTVSPSASTDTTSKLYTKSGEIVYTVKNGEYVAAVYADYYNTSLKFYTKTGGEQYRYTGWQTIDGITYFFDKNGNKVTGDQVILGAKYKFKEDGALVNNSGTLGIDVSKWNGSINWSAVRSSGVNYAIIRCGYRGSSSGVLVEDPQFKANIKGASSAGIKVGVYFFSQAISEGEAVEEASMCLNLVNGYKLSYPIFLDVEASGGRADSLDKGKRTAIIQAFCKTISNGGYSAGVYANRNWLAEKMDAGQLSSYKIWMAHYAESPSYSGKYDIWQYTSKGNIGGISGKTDLNMSYLQY